MPDLPEVTRVPDPKPVADMNEAELREHIELQEEYHDTDKQYKDLDIKKFHGMADIAMAALDRICNDHDNETGGMCDAGIIRWTEETSRKAIQEIRKLRDV